MQKSVPRVWQEWRQYEHQVLLFKLLLFPCISSYPALTVRLVHAGEHTSLDPLALRKQYGNNNRLCESTYLVKIYLQMKIIANCWY